MYLTSSDIKIYLTSPDSDTDNISHPLTERLTSQRHHLTQTTYFTSPDRKIYLTTHIIWHGQLSSHPPALTTYPPPCGKFPDHVTKTETKPLTPVIRPELAADGLTHVVEGMEVLGDGLIVLALQAGKGAEAVPLEAATLSVKLHSKRRHRAIEVGLLTSWPATVTAPQQTIGTWYRACKPTPCGEAYWG